jgi:hypothetical protein
VLVPGGWAYIGGGFGSKTLKESIVAQMTEHNHGSKAFRYKVQRNLGSETRTRFKTALEAAGIDDFAILHGDEIGLWIVMRK